MIWRAIILLVAFLALSNSELVENRIKKAVSIFNVVKVSKKILRNLNTYYLLINNQFFQQFKNDPCGATDMRVSTKGHFISLYT